VNLLGVVQRVVAREAQETGAVTIGVDAEIAVQADPELLARALANLVRNAVRYAGSVGPITIDAPRQGTEVMVRVTDSGPGIPAEQMNHLFEPFFRPDVARTRESGGTGLGLAIVKSCVDACQARIVCRNLEPRGFQAEITLQAAPGTATEKQHPDFQKARTD
jgi:two-component system sensor histidine kinase CpxA